MRFWHSALVLALVLVQSVWAGEIIEMKEMPENVDPADKKFIEDKQAARTKLNDERKAMDEQLVAKVKELERQREILAKPGTASVTVDDETKEVVEPANMEKALGFEAPRRVRDEYEISPDDFEIKVHDRWSINASDFKIDQPQYVTSELRYGAAKTWFGVTYSITNTTPKKRRIAPVFVAVTDKGVFNHQVGGFIPERIMADSTLRPLADSRELRDKEAEALRLPPLESTHRLANYAIDPEKGTAKLSPMETFEPGQTRWGAALWSGFSDEFTELKIVVHGLCNSHRYDEKMRRVLILTFERKDDEFHVHRSQLKYKDKRFDFLWAWDQDISVPLPTDAKDPQIKAQTLKTPSGGEKLVWAFPFVIKNSTRFNQSIAVNTAAFACPVEVTVGDAKVTVETKIVDDGRSSIYKAQMLKALGKEMIKDRFQYLPSEEGSKTTTERRMTPVESTKELAENWAIFDEADVDWADAVLQVETALTEKLDKTAAAAQEWERVAKAIAPDNKDLLQKNPGLLYDPRRRLTDDELKSVKEQIAKGIAGAVEAAKTKKRVVAYFDCTSALSTGTYRISRSYRKPGVVEEGWLTEWETWMKGWEAGSMGQ